MIQRAEPHLGAAHSAAHSRQRIHHSVGPGAAKQRCFLCCGGGGSVTVVIVVIILVIMLIFVFGVVLREERDVAGE